MAKDSNSGPILRSRLRIKCKVYSHWNRIEVKKYFIPYSTSDPKLGYMLPHYEAIREEHCSKCRSIIAVPKELIRIVPQEYLKQ